MMITLNAATGAQNNAAFIANNWQRVAHLRHRAAM